MADESPPAKPNDSQPMGNNLGPDFDISPDGKVHTTFGEWLVDVRTTNPIPHVFSEGEEGVSDRVYLAYHVETQTGEALEFEFDYLEGTASLGVSETGYVTSTHGGQELVGRAGTVTIEPDGPDAIRISFEDLELGPSNSDVDDLTDLTWVGSGLVTGPVRRVCMRAADTVHASGGAQAPAPVADEPSVVRFDAAWIEAFCTP